MAPPCLLLCCAPPKQVAEAVLSAPLAAGKPPRRDATAQLGVLRGVFSCLLPMSMISLPLPLPCVKEGSCTGGICAWKRRLAWGPREGSTRSSCLLPMSEISSSLTTLTSCCEGWIPLMTFTPRAFSSTRLTKPRTTGRDTCTT